MARRGENIYKRKDGRWEGRYKNGVKPDGKTRYSSVYGSAYSEVKRLLAVKRSEKKTETLRCSFTFKELADIWLESTVHSVKESTYANYFMKLEKHILPYFGTIKYERLTVKILNDFVDEKLRSGLSAKYVCDICRVVKSITKFARVKLGYADKAELLSLPKCEKRESKTLTSVQQNLLISCLSASSFPSDLGILTAAVTGIRIGELCAMQWSDIDLEKRIITVRRTMQRIKNTEGETATKIVITPPKSKTSEREIPIPDVLYSRLKAMQQDNDCYILTGKKIYADPRTMQYRFKAILKKLGLTQVNFHSLRHMFASRCIAVGADVKTLSEILGHSSVELTLNRYVHSSSERKICCMKLFSDNVSAV
ncbi:MAG: site-specific integrase [Eubacterium sp.]|nr:site-specific integrase [Eubacterium sp.]